MTSARQKCPIILSPAFKVLRSLVSECYSNLKAFMQNNCFACMEMPEIKLFHPFLVRDINADIR